MDKLLTCSKGINKIKQITEVKFDSDMLTGLEEKWTMSLTVFE